MFKNYFKTAWRNIVKSKFYSVLNIAGLTAGLGIGMLMLLWVQDEYSYDGFHKNADNIYWLQNRVGTGTSIQIWSSSVAPIGPLSKAQLPDVKDYVRISYNYLYHTERYADKVFKEENTVFADPSFFTIFNFPLQKGN